MNVKEEIKNEQLMNGAMKTKLYGTKNQNNNNTKLLKNKKNEELLR